MPLAAVTLDGAGTIFDVAEPVGATYARIGAQHGIAIVPDEVEGRFRAALATAPPLAFPGGSPTRLADHERAWWYAIVRRAFGPAAAARRFDACFAELFAHYARPEAWRTFDDVPATLPRLRARGLRLAVVSNFDQRLSGVLEGLGLKQLLDLVVHSSAVGAAKPDPDIFHGALARLGVSAEQTLHAGDGLVTDVEGARAAGLRAVLVDRADRRPVLPAGVARVGTLAELPALLADTGEFD